MQMIRSIFFAMTCAVLIMITGRTASALEASDLLFDLSFDNGLDADFSRGAARPVNQPEQLAERFVKGLIGKGYAFGGKGSGIAYATGDAADRISKEAYDPHVNLYGNSGTVSLWVTAAPGGI